MGRGRFWNYIRYVLLVTFSVIIVISIFWIYSDYRKVQNGAELSASEKAYDIKGDYLYDKSVLVISSYSPTYMIVPEEEDGIYDTLKEAGIGYEIDYMNYKEMGNSEGYEENFYTSLKSHLEYHNKRGTGFSAIMAGDDDALRFCMQYKEELFPNLPIVFYAVNDIPYAQECAKDPLVTGSIEKTYLVETIDLAQQLVPDANEFILIRDNTPTCAGDWETLQYVAKKYPDMSVSDINTEAMSTEEFCEQIGKLSDKAIVLCSVALKDNAGHILSLMKRFNLIGEYANVPVFSCYMHGIGNGATAGDAMYMRDCGETAAKQVVEILNNGVDPSEISLKAEGFHRIAIDEKMMEKNQLQLSDIPENALIINQTPNFWNTYREIFLPLMMIIGSLLGILILLAIDGFYIRKAKRHVEYQNNILDAISHEFISLWYVNASDHSYRLIRDHSATRMAKDSTSGIYLNEIYEEGIGWFIDHFVLEEDQKQMREQVSIENLLKNANEHEIYRVNFRLRKEDGTIRYCQVGFARTNDQDGHVHFAAGFHNIDEDMRRQIQQAQDLETAWKHANIDNMTGMLNRRAYEDKLRQLGADTIDKISIIYLDLNGLKEVNDNLGHEEGDRLIKGAASVIKDVFGELGDVFRTGGDEFVAVLLDRDETEEELREAVKNKAKGWKGNFSEPLSISFGMATSALKDNSKTIADLIKSADDAMYADKRAFYSAKGNDRRQRRNDITRNDVSNLIASLKPYCDEVRVVDLDKKCAFHYDERGQEYPDHMHCFEIWGKGQPCENCISAKAMQDHGKHSKIEEHDGESYFVTSQYVDIEGRHALLEIVQKLEAAPGAEQ